MNVMPDGHPSASGSSHEDHDLIRRINQSGADATLAFESLYRKHRDWSYRTAWRFTGDEHVAGEVVQDAFLHLLTRFPPHAGPFELRSRFTTYFYTVIRSIALTRHRRHRVDDRRTIQATEARHGMGNETSPDYADRAGALWKSLLELPVGQREAVILKYVDDLSIEEISIAMDIPAGTVKSRLHQAIARLKVDPRTQNLFEQ